MRRAAIRRILLATDLSPASTEAADQAVDLANDLAAELVILHVTDRSDLAGLRSAGTNGDEVAAEREDRARALTTRARDAGVRTTFLEWEGEVGPAIVDAASSEDVDLVVVGSHGRGYVGRLLLGSVSQHVVSNARCPVLVARPDTRRPVSLRSRPGARPRGTRGTR